MKAKEIEALESYVKTENEHWNEYAFKMLCEVLQQGQFENPVLPLELFSNSIDTFTDNHEHPLKALELFTGEIDKHKLNPSQKLFIYEWVHKYISNTEYEKMNLTPITDLVKSLQEKLKAENQPAKPLTKNIRETLKGMMQKELDLLPETLKGLEPVQRLNILCKLIPFVLPKVESINHEQGEPNDFFR